MDCHHYTCFSTLCQTEQKNKIIGTQHAYKVTSEKCLNLLVYKKKMLQKQNLSGGLLCYLKRYCIQATMA